MNNENLPQVIKENIFTKIKNWIIKLFKKDEIIQEEFVNITENEKISEKDRFKENIKVENKERIINLQKKLDNEEIKISDLSDNDIVELIELYKNQIQERRILLQQYKMSIAESN